MKKTLTTLLAIFVLLIGGLIVGPSFVDWSQYKKQAQDQIKLHTGYYADIAGDLSLALLPAPRLSVAGVTVKAGEEQLVALDRLDINLALMPLLSGKIDVAAVELINPDIRIAVLSNGTQNWRTPKVDGLLAGGGEQATSAGNDFAKNVSLQNITIKNGKFSYAPGVGQPATVLEDIDARIQATTLRGPFVISGALSFADKSLSIDANIDEITSGADSSAANIKGDYAGLAFSYGGALGIKEPFEAQGERSLNTDDLGAFLQNPALANQPLSFKGLVTGSLEGANVKAAQINVLGQNFSGDVGGTLQPLKITADLTGQDTFNLDALMPQQNTQAQAQGDITKASEALPNTLSLPDGFELRLNTSIPAAIYNGQTFKEIAATLMRQGPSLKANLKAKMPGGADASLRGDLSYASKSLSQKTNSEVLADPTLNIQLKVSAPNVAATAAALSAKSDLPFLSTAKTGDFDIVSIVKPGVITLQPSTVRLDSQTYKLSGSLKGKTLVANIDAYGGQLIVKGNINADMQLGNMAVQVKHGNLPKAIQTLTAAEQVSPFLSGPVDFYTELQQEGSVYTLSGIKAEILNSYVTGDIKFDAGAKMPSVSGALAFEDLVIPASQTSPVARGQSGGGQWAKDTIDSSFLHTANVDLQISANSIKYAKWDIAKPSLAFKLSDGALTVNELSAGLFGGQLAANANVTGEKTGPISVTANTQMNGVQIEQLVDALVGSRLIKGRGIVNLDGQISTTGANQAALVNALGGQGTVTGSNIVLEGFDANRFARALSEESKAGDSLLHLWKGTGQGGTSEFETLDGVFSITDGIVNMTKMDLDGPRTAIATKGTVNLPAWRLNSVHTISVKDRDDVPPFTINLEGPLNNPAQTFAQGAIQDYLSRKINRKLQKVLQDKIGGGDSNDPLNRLLGGVLGGGNANDNNTGTDPQNAAPRGNQSDQGTQQAPRAEPTPEDVINDVLRGLF